MKNPLFLLSVFLICVAASCKKNNEAGTPQSAQNEKALSAIEGKSYRLSAYYSMDANKNTEDLSSQVACALKDTIYFADASVTRDNGSDEITHVIYTVYTYCDPTSCFYNSIYNTRKYPGTFTGITMGKEIFQMPFPLNQIKFVSYPPGGVSSGSQSLAPGSLLFKDVDASNRLILYYNGIDNKTYYVELSRL